MYSIRSRGCVIIASLFFALFCGAALAQGYPSKPIRIILLFVLRLGLRPVS